MEKKKYSNEGRVPTPKKYQKSIRLIEKFEAMTSEERQAYLDKLEARMKEIKAFSDYLDRKNKATPPDGEKALFDSLKTAGAMGVAGAMLGMAYAPEDLMVESAIVGGVAMGGIVPFGQYVYDEIKTKAYEKELDTIMQEWVACSMVEKSPVQEF